MPTDKWILDLDESTANDSKENKDVELVLRMSLHALRDVGLMHCLVSRGDQDHLPTSCGAGFQGAWVELQDLVAAPEKLYIGECSYCISWQALAIPQPIYIHIILHIPIQRTCDPTFPAQELDTPSQHVGTPSFHQSPARRAITQPPADDI